MSWRYYVPGQKVSTMRMYEIFRKSIVTEKSTQCNRNGQYIFEVAIDATKFEIKEAAEKLFKVHVSKVTTSVLKGKSKVFKGIKGKRKDTKKAILSLRAGEIIDVATA